MGRDGFHGRLDHDDPALWQAQRPLRPQAGVLRLDRDLSGGLGPVRPGPGHDGAHRLSRDTRIGRGRTHHLGTDGDRRFGGAPRSRPLSGPLCRRLRQLQRRGAVAGRRHHRHAVMALDLLRQSAGRRGGGGPHRDRPQASYQAAHRPSHRLSWRSPAQRGNLLRDAGLELGGAAITPGLRR